MPSGSDAAVLIGRSDELELVRRTLDDASLHGVLVSGESGVGKSTLVAAISDELHEQGAHVLVGHCSPGALQLPYLPFVEALRPGDDRACSPFEGLHAAEHWTEWNTIRLWESVYACLGDRAGARRTLLVIEDLHWADESTRSLLDFIVRSRRIAGLSVVVTYREDELPLRDPVRGYVSELISTRRLAHVPLGRLDRNDARQLVQSLLAERRLAASAVNQMADRSEGNPMFATELVAAGADHASASLPPTLLDALARRLARLTHDGLIVARHAALSLVPVDDTLLAAALEWPGERAAAGMRDALAHHVLVPTGGGTGLVIRHALLREALLVELLPGERRRIHRALAEALPGSNTGALAYHWDAAGSAAEALDWAVAAAIEAANANGLAEATRLFDQALGWWDDLPDVAAVRGRTKLDVLELAADASLPLGDRRRSLGWLEQAMAIAEDEPVERRLGLLARLANLHRESGDVAQTQATLDRAYALQPMEGGPEWTQLKAAEGALRFIMTDHDGAVPLAAAARTAAQARGAAEEEAGALFVLAVATTFAGDVEGGIRLADDLIRVSEAASFGAGIVQGYFTAGFVRQAALRFEDAAEAFDRGSMLAAETHVEGWIGADLVAEAAEARRRAGHWAVARRRLDDALAAFEGPVTEERVVRALLAVGQGDLETAATDLEIAGRRLRAPLPWVDQSGKFFAALGGLELLRERPDAALDAAQEGISRIAASRDLRWLGDLSAVGLRALSAGAAPPDDGTVDAMLAPFREAAAIARERRNIFALEVDAHEATIEAELAALRGRPDAERWLAARDAWHRIGQPHPAATAAVAAAGALFAGRHRREGRRALAEAHAIATELGARPLLERIARLDVNLGTDDLAPTGRELHRAGASWGLTARETQLLGLLTAAPSDDEIARELVISPKTVSVHVSNLKAKVGVATRAELVRVAIDLRNGERRAN